MRRLVAEPVSQRGDEPVGGVHDLGAGAEDEEVAGAVGVLGLAGVERGLPEGRRLLIAEDAGRPAPRAAGSRTPMVPKSPDELRICGNIARGMPNAVEQVVVPVEGLAGP